MNIPDNPTYNILGYLPRYKVELRKIGILQRLSLRRAMSEETTIFDKILDGSIPATFIHQDDKCVAFNDVAPQVRIKIKENTWLHMKRLNVSEPSGACALSGDSSKEDLDD